jgi:DNA-binding MarR family transcriptional regulator
MNNFGGYINRKGIIGAIMDNNSNMIYSNNHIESSNTIQSCVLFIQTSREVLKYVDTCIRYKAGISMMQFLTLMILEQKLGKTSPSEIARFTQTKRNNITTLIRRMKKDGYISVNSNSSDRRGVNVVITKKGKEILAQSTRVADEVITDIMHSFTEDDLSIFTSQLYKIMNNTRSGFNNLIK